MSARGGFVYILTNVHHTTLYVGVTSRLLPRMVEHLMRRDPRSFTARYNLTKLVHVEGYVSIVEAIAREKQVKAWSRAKKEALIAIRNPSWTNLLRFEEGEPLPSITLPELD